MIRHYWRVIFLVALCLLLCLLYNLISSPPPKTLGTTALDKATFWSQASAFLKLGKITLKNFIIKVWFFPFSGSILWRLLDLWFVSGRSGDWRPTHPTQTWAFRSSEAVVVICWHGNLLMPSKHPWQRKPHLADKSGEAGGQAEAYLPNQPGLCHPLLLQELPRLSSQTQRKWQCRNTQGET